MRSRLRALERNILKYRAFQMILLLHQVESLRSFVIGSIRATDSLSRGIRVARLPVGAKRPMEKALALLVEFGVLEETESRDLQKIFGLRDKIGHTIHELVADISAPKVFGRSDPIYDYFALKRFERYREKIVRGMSKHFVLQAGIRDLSFERAEATYKEELSRLRDRIDRQFEARRAVA